MIAAFELRDGGTQEMMYTASGNKCDDKVLALLLKKLAG
jgi:hypothetical protein